MQKVIEIQGENAEIRPSPDSDSTAIRSVIKQLMILSYEGVISVTSTREKSKASTPQDNSDAPEIMSSMFKTLSALAKNCPIFLLSVSRDGQPAGELVVSSVQATPGTLNVAEVEVSSSAIEFLEVLVSVCG